MSGLGGSSKLPLEFSIDCGEWNVEDGSSLDELVVGNTEDVLEGY